jgi:serine/threonine protein kinase
MAELEAHHDAEPVGQSVPRPAVDLSGIHSTMQRNPTTFTQIRTGATGATQTTPDAPAKIDFLTLISLACNIYRIYASELVEMQPFRGNPEQSEGRGGNCLVTRREITLSSPSNVLRGQTEQRNESIIVKRTHRAFWGSGTSALRSFIVELRVRAHPPLREHPNIVGLKGIAWDFEDEERRNPCPLLLEERASEGSLEQFWKVRNLTRMPFKLKVALCSDIASGLLALHNCGIVHGDVKPENILVFPRMGSQESYAAKLTDFGHSVLAYENLDAPPAFTPLFGAPELEEQSSFSFQDMKQTDVYSYGLVVLCLVVGRNCCSDFGSQLLSYKLDDSIVGRAMRLLEQEDRKHSDSDFDLATLRMLFNNTLKRDSKKRDLPRCIRVLYRQAFLSQPLTIDL